MDLLVRVGDFLSDERLVANLIGVHVLLGTILVVSFLVRKTLLHGGDSLAHWTGLHWLDRVGQEANRRIRSVMLWSTVTFLAVAVATGVIYHVTGRDLRIDLRAWYEHLTGAELLALAWTAAKLVALAASVRLTCSLVRRGRTALEKSTHRWLQTTALDEPGIAGPPADEESVNQDQTAARWFFLLERFTLAAVVLGGLWMAAYLLGWAALDAAVGFLLRLLTIVMVARLATLASRTVFHVLERFGGRALESSPYRRYWERVARLFPFAHKCFEAAVYVYAATMCVALLRWVEFIGAYGENIVKCIGVFFVTRIVIELAHTLVNEAFGVYDEERPADQKGMTLAPLLQSVLQYLLYFGSAIVMLEVCSIPTQPFLAGAGILGLAGGLGAQSLVTDLVSGFFILFENQYLVGDVVQIGDAHGRVEAVSIRTTQIRDETGRLHIIPNGQVKNVVNFSKGYVNAVVDYKTPTSASLEQVTADMAEAGRRLRKLRREVIGETTIKGLVELTPSDMVIRVITKVQPGAHQAMQVEYRRLLKQVLDERQSVSRVA